MQQKHKKRPIVPIHTAVAPAGGKAAAADHGGAAAKNSSAKAHNASKQNQRKHNQTQQQRQQGNGMLGKRKSAGSAQLQPVNKKQHQDAQSKQGRMDDGEQQLSRQQPQKLQSAQQPQQQKQVQQPQQQQQQKKKQPQQQQQLQSLHASGKNSKAGSDTTQRKFKKFKKFKKHKATKQAAGDAAAVDSDKQPATVAADSKAELTAAAAVVKPWQPKEPAGISSNWQALKQQLQEQQAAKPKRLRKGQGAAPNAAASAAKKQISSTGHNKAATPIVAMDCEMVGVGPGGDRDSLARVSIVNASGNVLLDLFVAQKEPVTDYRTWVSGVKPEHLVGAPSLEEVQTQVAELLKGRTIVGHGLKKDLSVLMLSHSRKHIRDTAKYPPFMFSKGGKRRPRALRHLAQQELGLTIQEGQHSSVDDARAALYLYQKHAATWERALKTVDGLKHLPTANRAAAAGTKKKRIESYAVRNVKDDPMADL